jgi:chorismate mutase-like protein
MPPSLTSLDQLRQEIDGIDDQLHDLLMRRAALVGDIRAAKPAGKSTVRPAREHAILKRLMERHRGDLPRRTVLAIWREIMDGFSSLQGAGSVIGPARLETLAVRHFGSAMEYVADDDPASMLARVSSGKAAWGILPWPGEKESWWVEIAGLKDRPSIVCTLPYLMPPQAVAFAMVDPEPTGDDCSLVVVKARGEVPFAKIKPVAAAGSHRLIEVPRYIAPDDPKVTETSGVVLLGSYPRPS